jgi:hypothetical protein
MYDISGSIGKNNNGSTSYEAFAGRNISGGFALLLPPFNAVTKDSPASTYIVVIRFVGIFSVFPGSSSFFVLCHENIDISRFFYFFRKMGKYRATFFNS